MAQLYLKGVYFDTDSGGLWYLDNSGSYHQISAGIQSVTFDELSALIGSSGLTIEKQYLISDFATVHYIVDGSGNKPVGNPIITGDVEPLIVTASGTDKINSLAISTTFPQDIINIDFDENNWLADLSFSDSGTIVAGWKGTITFRHDTLLDNYCGYDFRNCKFRRWKTAAAAWNSGTSYSQGDFVTFNFNIYKAIQASSNKQPNINTAFWVGLLDLTVNEYWNNNPTSSNGIPSDSLFDDFKTFSEGAGSATYNLGVRCNHIQPTKDNSTYFDAGGTLLGNNVFFLQDNSYFSIINNFFGGEIYGNTIIAEYLADNIFAGDMISNILAGDSTRGNVFGGTMLQNIIGRSMTSNNVAASFIGNAIGSNMTQNTIGAAFGHNTVGTQMANNTIGSNFSNNIGIKPAFRYNTIDNDAISGTDFSSATHVYGAYHCTLFKRQDGTARLSYFNNSDVLTVVNANA